MATLRSDNGCPWDREQTRQTLKPYLVEETYEVLEAIDAGAPAAIREELGDLLFQIVFHSRIAEELGEFDLDGVIETISEKMVRRHPHVFGDACYGDSAEVIRQWEDRKKEEGKHKDSVLAGVPKELPSLLRAHRIQARASRVGFDWGHVDEVMEKLTEELTEFRDALARQKSDEIKDELGDVFFSLVNVARFVGVNPEDALRKTISKFISRFRHIEMRAADKGRTLSDMTLQEMDALWEEAKKDKG